MMVLRAEESTNSWQRERIYCNYHRWKSLYAAVQEVVGGNSKKKLKILFVKVDCSAAVAIFLREKMQQKSIWGIEFAQAVQQIEFPHL